MAGHSKWAGIKHKKAIVDARRGKLFTKLARAITVAAQARAAATPTATRRSRSRSRRPRTPRCRRTTSSARSPRAPARAATPTRSRPVLYEGYGPGGVALLVEALTDNRNRTGAEVRHMFSKHGGSLGEPGSVAYLFDKRGLIVVDGDALLRGRPDAGDRGRRAGHLDDDDVFEVLTEPGDLPAVRAALEEAGVEIESAELVLPPTTRVPVDEDDGGQAHAADRRRSRSNDDVERGARELRRRRGRARARGAGSGVRDVNAWDRPPVVLRRERPFRLLFWGQALSSSATGSPRRDRVRRPRPRHGDRSRARARGLRVPFALFAIAGGVVADRVGRRTSWSSPTSCARRPGAVAALLLTGSAEVWLLVILSGRYGTAAAVFMPALTGLIPQTVAPDRLQEANALLGVHPQPRDLRRPASPASSSR